VGDNWSVQVPVAPLDMPASPDNLMLKITSARAFNGQAVPPLVHTLNFGSDQNGTPASRPEPSVPTSPRGAVAIHMIRAGDHARIAGSSGNEAEWNTPGVDTGRQLRGPRPQLGHQRGLDCERQFGRKRLYSRRANATLPMISVRKTLVDKYDLSKGLRQIKPSRPLPANSLRAILFDNPPQFAP
jgi:hypothetical protein